MLTIKNIAFIVLTLLTLISCKRDIVEDKVKADFTYQVEDSNYSAPVRILFVNTSSGAQQYKWTFEGAVIPSYDQKEPGVIKFENPGKFKVTLEVWKDQLRDQKSVEIIIDSVPTASFDLQPVINNYGITDFNIVNLSAGGIASYKWSFENGIPSASIDINPGLVRYSSPGEYIVSLEAINTRGKKSIVSKKVKVFPALQANFEIIPSFDDEDYEAPLTATLQNQTISALHHVWQAPGGIISNVNDSIPTVTFNEPGTYSVTYRAGNNKDTATQTRTITIKPNTHLRTFTDVKLGINTAQQTVGNYFSTTLRTILKKDQVTNENGDKIDIAFYGLSQAFNYNLFFSPDEAKSWTFADIPGATATKFINSLESCSCSIDLDAAGFDNITDGNFFNGLNISVTEGSKSPFDKTIVPRVIVFENAAKKKGAIKIKDFVQDGANSYILCDIKVQKD